MEDKFYMNNLSCRLVLPAFAEITKNFTFLVVFLLTIFDSMLKYPTVSQKANAKRQRAKMTFQFACRKLQRNKDLEPSGPVELVNIQ